MRSYAVTRFCEPIEVLDEPDPVPSGTEVVVEVTRCGLCHSDIHLHQGYYDLGGGKKLSLADRGVQPPVVMGHEILGRLAARGPDAPIDAGEEGRTFLVYPWIGCGTCEICRSGRENLCAAPRFLGVHRPGGYAEKIVVPHPRYLVPVDDIDPSVAATYACSGLTSYSALKRAAVDRDRDWLLLIGAGGVGQNALIIARALGQKRIAVADIDPQKREVALAAGAEVAVDPADAGAVAELTGLEGGIAAAIDFVGAPSTANFALATLRRAGTYVVVGMYGGEITLSLPLLPMRAITIGGSYVGNLGELKELIALVRDRRMPALPVETVPASAVNDAMEKLTRGEVRGRLVLSHEA